MKTKEELNAIKNEVEMLSRKLAELDEEELQQVAGGMSAGDDAVLNGAVLGHLFDAFQAVQKTKNDYLITMIAYLQMKCKNKEYAEMVKTISGLLTAGVYNSSDKAAYDSLEKAKKAIENSGILNA